jgi:kinesin family protein 6/9
MGNSDSNKYVDNTKNEYLYYFNDVFGMSEKQEGIFENLAKEVVDNCLDGYNGTIFAYGQTGSGKTYTMTGTPERYVDRGIIPRTISYLFKYAQSNSDKMVNYSISYLEIYNNDGKNIIASNLRVRPTR